MRTGIVRMCVWFFFRSKTCLWVTCKLCSLMMSPVTSIPLHPPCESCSFPSPYSPSPFIRTSGSVSCSAIRHPSTLFLSSISHFFSFPLFFPLLLSWLTPPHNPHPPTAIKRQIYDGWSFAALWGKCGRGRIETEWVRDRKAEEIKEEKREGKCGMKTAHEWAR